MTNGLRQRLADRSMTLDLTEDARRLIADRGFDPVYGARPLRRFIARDVETRIGRALVNGDAREEGAEIEVDAADGDIAVRYKNAA
jgi:ATP-dependent Clp protease ATP-binding subunit ClpB